LVLEKSNFLFQVYDVGQIIGKDVFGFNVKVEYRREVGAVNPEDCRLEKRILNLTREIEYYEKRLRVI